MTDVDIVMAEVKDNLDNEMETEEAHDELDEVIRKMITGIMMMKQRMMTTWLRLKMKIVDSFNDDLEVYDDDTEMIDNTENGDYEEWMEYE